MSFTLGLAMLVSATFGSGATASSTDLSAVPISKPQTVEQTVRTYFADAPVMAEISHCESKFRQYDKDGNVLRGVVSSDVGVMQVNEYYHSKEAAALGYDLHTLEGNMAYARFLYEREGTTPWMSSSRCWLQHTAQPGLALNS